MADQPIAFIDLMAQQALIRSKVDRGIKKVLDHGAYVMGPEVTVFEEQVAKFSAAEYAISCANGTDALQLALMCEGVGPGDAVFIPSFTFIATAEAPVLVGAVPVFVDVLEGSFNMCPESLKLAIEVAKEKGLKPTIVMPVDLFGQPADYPAINAIAKANGCVTIADAAQGFGGALHNQRVGALADYTTTSFFPAKPLGCYGDGGAVLTNSKEKADRLKSIRIHGQGSDKYDNVLLGVNSRLDSIQAAILIEKLAIFEDELDKRAKIASRYNDFLRESVVVPDLVDGAFSAWAQYTIRVPNRDEVALKLKELGVPTAVYYPRPAHVQLPYEGLPVSKGGLPVTEKLAREVLSLPMYPYLAEEMQDRVIEAVLKVMGEI